MGDENNPAAKFQAGKCFGKFKIVRKLDQGGFGHVYLVEHKEDKSMQAALKAEPNDVEGGSAIKLEISVLRGLNKDGSKSHIPLVMHAAKHAKFSYMIMTLLGENLKNLKLECRGELMSAGTWSRIGIQCLAAIKQVHDFGYVHRDIKPNNFVMGHKEDMERARMVHILDFGLSRAYAFKSIKDPTKWVARRARGSAEFRGTLRYCSPTVHERLEQGRKDDLWSLFYVLIELHCGLPWQTVRGKKKIELMKMQMPDAVLCLNFPKEMHKIVPYLRTLDCYSRPDYTIFYDGLIGVMKSRKVKWSDPYDWEQKNMERLKKVLDAQKKPPTWEDLTTFFKDDPLGIDKAPTIDNEEWRELVTEEPSKTSKSQTQYTKE
ncbi:unnamed protein product, partial [Mesorhabditis belari]|uniref:non-specific serine/threonine protein kinase n=1 Tax=Mesorhabditis belari TaxID=2138241 RepID=A0AAF3FCC7_9BILA